MNKQKIVTLILFFLLIIFFGFHKVSKVTCVLNQTKCDSDLQNKVSALNNKSFFFTDFHKEVSELEGASSIYLIKSIQKRISGEIILELEQETVLYSLRFENQDYFLGASGIILPSQPNSVITKIIWQNDEPILKENQISQKYHTILKNFSINLAKQKINKVVMLYWISNDEIVLEIESKPTFIFDSQTLETNSKKIGTILEAREIDTVEAPIQEIDMRFELPVLRTAQ